MKQSNILVLLAVFTLLICQVPSVQAQEEIDYNAPIEKYITADTNILASEQFISDYDGKYVKFDAKYLFTGKGNLVIGRMAVPELSFIVVQNDSNKNIYVMSPNDKSPELRKLLSFKQQDKISVYGYVLPQGSDMKLGNGKYYRGLGESVIVLIKVDAIVQK